MNRIRKISLLAIAIAASFGIGLSHPRPVSAACAASVPYTFTNLTGTYSTVDANTTNSNNAFLLACAKNVDNTQIGTAGIYANQIIPLTVGQATFGGTGTYVFPAGLGVSGNSTAVLATPGSGTTVATIAGTSLCGYNGTIYVWCFDNSGDEGIAGSFHAGTSVYASTSFLETTAYSSGFNDALIFNSGTGTGTTRFGSSSGPSTDGIVGSAYYVDNGQSSTLETLDASGDLGVASGGFFGTTLQAGSGVTTRTGTNAYTQLLPVYLANGSAVGNTWHGTFAQCTTSASNSCSVMLSGAGTFSNSTSWGCGLSANTSFASNTLSVQITSGTAATFSYSGSPGNITLTGLCWGF